MRVRIFRSIIRRAKSCRTTTYISMRIALTDNLLLY